MSNPYANKPFLDQQMAKFLNTSYTQGGFVSTTDASFTAANSLRISIGDTSFNNLKLGSLLDVSGTRMGIVKIDTATGIITTDVSSGTLVVGTAIPASKVKVINDISGSTVQNIVNTFLTSPFDSSANISYYQLAGASVEALNNINLANPTAKATGKNGVRLFISADDGTPIFDSGKCAGASSSNATNQLNSLVGSAAPFLGNTYNNFKNKITIGNTTTYGAPVDPTTNMSLTLGTAGGNSINENHNSRPEFLGALFAPTGIAYSRRMSSTTLSTNLYIANRMGISSEENLGAVRLNVPTSEA